MALLGSLSAIPGFSPSESGDVLSARPQILAVRQVVPLEMPCGGDRR